MEDHLRERRPNESTEERLCSEERQLPPQLTERDVLPRFVRTPPRPRRAFVCVPRGDSGGAEL